LTPDIDLDAVYKALANRVRREILAWLREPQAHFAEQELPLDCGVSARQIEARCDLAQSTVSAHLAALERAGLVTASRIGQWAFFKRDEQKIQLFLAHINAQL
jgi:DNA-binding transcriptional ArsR family regulator